VRTVPVPGWVKAAVDEWLAVACIEDGRRSSAGSPDTWVSDYRSISALLKNYPKNLKYSAILSETEVHFAKARMLDRQGDTVSNRTALYTLFPDNQAHPRIHAVPRESYRVHTPLRSGSSIIPLMCRVCELLCPYHRQLRMHVRAQTA